MKSNEILNNTTLNFARPQSPSHTASTTATQKKIRELPRIITNFSKIKSWNLHQQQKNQQQKNQQQQQEQQQEQQPQQLPQPLQPQPQLKDEVENNLTSNNKNNDNNKKSNNRQSVQSVRFALDPNHSKRHQKSESDHHIITDVNKKNNNKRYKTMRRSSAPVTGSLNNNSEEDSKIPTVNIESIDNNNNVLLSSSPPQPQNNNYVNVSSSVSSSLDSNACSLSPPSLTPSSSVSSLSSSVGQLITTKPKLPPSSSLTPAPLPSLNNFNLRPKSKSISTENPFTSYSLPDRVTPASYDDVPWSPAVSFLSSLASATSISPSPDDEGQQVGDYVLGKIIGRGGFSTVREGYTMDNSCTMEKALLEREIAIWRELKHPNIIEMFSVKVTEYATFIFSEFCPGGTLLQYIKNHSKASGKGLDEDESRHIFLEVSSALRYLHNDMKLVHKDIKLDNIILGKDDTWKICDFGLTEFQNPEANGFSNLDEVAGGSLAYSSPEQLRSKISLRDPAVDIWSLAVVLYALVTGQLPFMDDFEPRLQSKIINGRYDESVLRKAGADNELCDLLNGMFKVKPDQRLTITQVLDHPWCQP
ncbi:12052_t:CDS:2 [Entrophospora sp. SA101]|nr:12052_t:CDS:2 [Entrophospora sp. SA101]